MFTEPWPDEVTFDSWRDLAGEFIGADLTGWIFRGQPSASYPLTTKLERDLIAVTHGLRDDVENAVLVHFQDRARAHLSEVPDRSDLLGWWSLMQHYGAPTRLLDWTASPFVALYFALVEPGVDEAALWCLNAWHLRNRFGFSVPFGIDHLGTKRMTTSKDGAVVEDGYPYSGVDWHAVENERLRRVVREQSHLPYPVVPSRMDARMLAQQTVLTCDGAITGGISFPLGQVQDSSGWVGQPARSASLLKKIRLAPSIRRDALISLQAMGITEDSLFPGLDGIGRATSLRVRADLPATMRDLLEGRGPWAHTPAEQGDS